MLTLNKMFRLSIVMLSISAIFLSYAFAGKNNFKALKKDPVKIDFNDIVKANGTQSKSKYDSTLKIAVAAMISPKYTYKYYVELLNLIGERMSRNVLFVQKRTYSEVNEMLKRNELDIAFVCSGPYVSGKENFGMEIIAVPVCHGEKVYYAYFIAHKNNKIKSFDDFRGKIFAFTDPLSNTGFMVPNYYLARLNETPESFFKKTFFTYSHDNSIQAVANSLADGAAVDSLIYEFMKVRNPELTTKTIIIDRSAPYGIPPVVVAPSMEPEIKEKLKKLFISIHKDPKGKRILRNLQIDRFVEGNDDDYNTVRELHNFIKSKQR